ncbi:uncharacterized protein LOC144546827 isoform X3 [Carex rostrata]
MPTPLLKSESMDQAPVAVDYEKCREERIKSNMERMQQLGILNLSRNVNSAFKTPNSSANPKRQVLLPTDGSKKKVDLLTPSLPSRRSSRLQKVAPVNYTEVHGKKSNDDLTESDVALIEEGRKEELYTEEHEKLIGSCEAPWTLFVDGYGKDNKRIYDPVKGKTCHQCRYGENVLEAIKNPDWMCPVCRGICNCSLCRLKKGWNPTGALYKKVVKLGYKSVAHYLIETRRKPANSDQAPSSEINGAMSDNTEAAKENEPKPEILSDESSIVVITNENSAINDGETMGKRCRQVKRKKGEVHTGNLSPSPGPIATRLRRRLYGI